MIKCLGLFSIFFLFFACATGQNASQTGGEVPTISALPTIEAKKTNFSPYFSTIQSDILLDIQIGSPSSIQRAISSLRSGPDSEQANVLLAVCESIMKFAWPSSRLPSIQYDALPVNVYTSTLESIERGIYEESFGEGTFLTLTLPSLVLFLENTNTTYYDSARASLEKSLALTGDSVLALYLLGILEMRTKDYSQSKEYLQKAMALSGENIDLIYTYLDMLLESGNAQEAYDFASEVISRYPSDLNILEFLAIAAYDIGDYQASESFIAQSLRFAPDNSELILLRAKVLFELKDYLDASSLLDVYARTGSQDKDYLIIRAKLQSEWNKNVPAAIRTIQEALTLYPNDLEILLHAANLSSVSAQRIEGKTASDFLEIILAIDPENIQALEILVTESIMQQQWHTGYDASIIVMAQDTKTVESVLQHTEICIELGLLNEARIALDNVYTASSNNERMQQWNIRLLIAEGNYTEAGNIIETLLSNANAAMKSMLYFERSRLQSADTRILSDLRASLTSNPRNVYALFGLYTYYFDRQDYSKAQYYLKQVIALNPSNTEALAKNAELDKLL